MNKKLLKSISRIYEQSQGCGLELEFLENAQEELQVLAEYLNVSSVQACIFSVIMGMNCNRNAADTGDLINHFACNPIKIFEYVNDLEALHKKGILQKMKKRKMNGLPGKDDQFSVRPEVLDAILKNRPFMVNRQEGCKDEFDLLDKVYDLLSQREDEEISSPELYLQVNSLIKTHRHFSLVEKVYALQLCNQDLFIYLLLIWETHSGKSRLDLDAVLQVIIDESASRVRYLQLIMRGENDLIEKDLCVLEEASFLNDVELKLTQRSMGMLNTCGLKIMQKSKSTDNLVKATDISNRDLFFNEEEMEQLRLFETVLQEEKMEDVQIRLLEKGMSKGITALFHGAPGNGKTEAAMQIARQTGRDVIRVDISQTKSMWFGQSEKIIKKIFTDYDLIAKESEKLPLLLFNEADAIFFRRSLMSYTNVSQTENTMQNILLEELERFKGILIATTNLTDNLDKAFDRRFLFKIYFGKPDVKRRAKIWALKLKGLSDSEYDMLARRFNFSGGQIDNIARKNQIEEVVHGSLPSFDRIVAFCEDEITGKKTEPVGFKAS